METEDARAHVGRTITLVIPPHLAGERLDRALARLLPSLSRSYVKKLVKDGYCLVNGAIARPTRSTAAGDVVVLSLLRPAELPCQPVPGPLDVRYEDEHVLVVAKPAGQVCHPAKGHHRDTLLNAVVAHLLPEIERGWSRPHLVNRLDRFTSGLVLIAKTPLAHRALQKQIERRQVRRRYLALVWGKLELSQGIVNRPLAEVRRQERSRTVVSGDGRPARTRFVRGRRFALAPGQAPAGAPAWVTVVHAELDTGRMHQVRVHFADLGHPVLGDDMYGPW
ncbi:MAG: RluA family pseudouridine synthase, partial [Armatimonadetes bacterium]|nr:RluA family pseudouridine synthase [Armatimonadota bacterium]